MITNRSHFDLISACHSQDGILSFDKNIIHTDIRIENLFLYRSRIKRVKKVFHKLYILCVCHEKETLL